MPNKRLSPKEVEEIKGMVIAGASPEDLSTHFGISISSVHNYKNRFKNAGIEYPSVRGKRPSGEVMVPHVPQKDIPGIVKLNGHMNGNSHVEMPHAESIITLDYTIIVEGLLNKSGKARNINIGHDKIEIIF